MSHEPQAQHHDSHHPTFKQYVLIAIILFAITIVEFLIVVPQSFKGSSAVVAPLIILSAIKFGIVIMFYMHLKFDSRMFSLMFLGGLALGFAVVLAVLGLFGSFTPTSRDFAEANAAAFAGHEAEGGAHEVEQPESPEVVQPPEGGSETPVEQPPSETGGGEADLVAQGQAVFIGAGGCLACHTIEGVSSGLVGPDLTHIGTAGATRQPGVSARDYITESIKSPEAFVAPGVERAIPGVMTSVLTASLSDTDVEALVEFLLAQK